jgi:hypothetical protein
MRPMWGCMILSTVLLGGLGCGQAKMAAKSMSSRDAAKMESAAMPGEETAPDSGSATVSNAAIQPPSAMRIQRSMIRRAALTVRVENVEKSEKAANALVSKVGGFVEGTESNDLSSAEAQITMTVRVPVKTFDQTIADFEALGVRINKRISGEDVTGQLLDYGARIKVMRAQEEVYRNLLKQSKRMDDVVSVQQKLMELRSNIESTTAQLQGLSELAALSTIELTLSQSLEALAAKPADQSWAGESWAEAKGAGLAAFRGIITVLMWAIWFVWIWLPIVLLIRWAVKSAKSKPQPVTPPPQQRPPTMQV